MTAGTAECSLRSALESISAEVRLVQTALSHLNSQQQTNDSREKITLKTVDNCVKLADTRNSIH